MERTLEKEKFYVVVRVEGNTTFPELRYCPIMDYSLEDAIKKVKKIMKQSNEKNWKISMVDTLEVNNI